MPENLNPPKVSIIVPVYNVEKYLPQCLDSILAQTYTDWECILVDDGSTDGSETICDEYAEKDARFKVIHKGNGGVSSARNVGIEKARGEWITFVDADDKIRAIFLESLSQLLLSHSAIVVSASQFAEGTLPESYIQYSNNIVSIRDFVEHQLRHWVSWGYLFKKSIIDGHSIRFDENLSMSEDALFIMHFFQHIPSIATLSAPLYLYRKNPLSVCNSGMTYDKAQNHYCATTKMLQIEGLPKSSISRAFLVQLHLYLVDLKKIRLSKNEKKEIRAQLINIYKMSKGLDIPKYFILAAYSLTLYQLYHKTHHSFRKIFTR